MKISATTVMMPEHDLRETAELLAKLGFDGAEWRCRQIPESQRDKPLSPWGNVKNDLSPDNLGERGEELVAVSKEVGLAVVGLATNMPANDLDDVRKVAEGCAKWGIPMFRIGAPSRYSREANYREVLDEAIRAMEPALAITRDLGVKMILEIHRGTVACSASQAYLVVKHFDPADLGVIFDIANMSLGEGYEPWGMGLDLLGPYVAHVHAAGGKAVEKERREDGHAGWAWDCCDLADSLYDVPLFVAQLKERDYQGFLSLEDFRGEAIETKLSRNLAYLQGLVDG